MTTRMNVQLEESLRQVGELPVAVEVERALHRPFWDPNDQKLIEMGAALSETLKHLSEVAKSRGRVRVRAFADFCIAFSVSRAAHDSIVADAEEFVFSKVAVGLLIFLEQFTPDSDLDVSLAETRLSIVCDHHTGALALQLKGHINRLLGIIEEEVK